MISRSASRTRWMMFCFAAWAAMRPNFSGGSLARSSSPTSASGSIFARATSSVTWFSGSSTCSTTILISNSSTSPSSVLNLASMFFSWPKVFLAADRRARLQPSPLAERTAVVRRAQERAVDAGRRAFELVAPGDGVVCVEQVTELARHARQLVERHTALGAVEQEAQHYPAPLGAVLHVHELEAPREREGLRELPDALGHRGRIHELCSSKNEKVGGAHSG